jgi:hypothetical protein
MESIVLVHGALSRTIAIFFLLLGLWGLVRAIRGQAVTGSYLGALVIGEVLFALQAILGLVMIVGGEAPARVVHLIYGTFALVALPGLFAFIRGDDSNQAQWYYAILTLFLFGVSLRAIGTGTGAAPEAALLLGLGAF